LYFKSIAILFLLLIFQLEVSAGNIANKGETCSITVSPLSVQQQKDSIIKNKYKTAERLYKNKEYSQSLKLALILIEDLKISDNENIVYLCNFLIGDSFYKMNNHKKALAYYKKSLTVLNRERALLKDRIDGNTELFFSDKRLVRNLLKIGTGYVRLNKKDSAKYFYKKIVNINSLNKDLLNVKAAAYNNLSGIYSEDSLYDIAREFSLKSLEIRKKTKNKLLEASALGNLASIYAFEEKYRKSKEIYLEAIKLIENDKSSTAFRYKKDLYFNLAWALYNLKDYTAYDYQEKSYDIKDSIRDAEVRFIVKDVFAKHQENLQREKTELVKSQVAL
jgi:tetratricopeptide (TPR) repeat protein